MARTPRIKAAEMQIEASIPAAHLEVVKEISELTGITENYNEERDLLNQLLGQAQMADAFAKFSRTVRTSKLAFVRENKLYRALKGKQSANGSRFDGTWEEFCELLGTSRDKVELDIANLKAFGEEALDSMSRMGIGYREMRQYRKLPDDEKSALLEVAKSGDKDAFIDLAESLVTKHAKEKAQLARKLADLEADQQATEKVLTEKNKKLDQIQTSLEKLQLRTAPWDERIAPFKEEITQRQSIIDEAVARHLQAVEALDAWVNTELAQLPGYDPESTSEVPAEVLTVLMHLSSAVDRTVTLAANAQHAFRLRFGGYVDEAQQYLPLPQ